ncbi:MAG: Cyanate transporter [Actinomycetia bacterium]|nr:Cyanate transporter [Actinomycetes bacterium]
MNLLRRGSSAGTSLEATLLVVGVAALGFNRRGTIAGLPPLYPDLQARLHLSSAEVSLLAATPVLCFGVVSGAAAPLGRRLGEERTLLLAMVVLTAGLLLRAVAPDALLFPGTILACAGIAVMNVLLGSLIKRRWPQRAGFLVGLYITSLSVGAIISSFVSVPLYHSSGGSIGLTLGWLVVPAALGAVLWLPQLRHGSAAKGSARATVAAATGTPSAGPSSAGPSSAAGPQPEPEPATTLAARLAPPKRSGGIWRHALSWQVTLFMGIQSLLYYATLSWLPTIFQDRGVSAAGAGDLLGVLGVGNLALALVAPVLAQRMRTQYALVIPIVIGIAVGTAGAVWAPLGSAVIWMLILGAAQNAALGLAIYFTMARAPDPATAASLSAMAQGVGYLLASAGPLEVGLVHSATGSWNPSIVVLLALTVVLLAAGLLAARPRMLPSARQQDHDCHPERTRLITEETP